MPLRSDAQMSFVMRNPGQSALDDAGAEISRAARKGSGLKMTLRLGRSICMAIACFFALSLFPALAFAQEETPSEPVIEAGAVDEDTQADSAAGSNSAVPDASSSSDMAKTAIDQPVPSAEQEPEAEESAVLNTADTLPELTVYYTINFDVSNAPDHYLDNSTRAGTVSLTYADPNATWSDGSKGVKTLTGSVTTTQRTKMFGDIGIPARTFSADDVSSENYTLREWVMASWSYDEFVASGSGSGGSQYYSETTLFFYPDSSMEHPDAFIGSSMNLFMYPRNVGNAEYLWNKYVASHAGESKPSDLLAWADAISANDHASGFSWESNGCFYPFDQYGELHLVINLVAEWCPALTFDSNNGAGQLLNQHGQVMDSQQLQVNKAMKITTPQASLQRNGMVQTGWNTRADGNGTHYDALVKLDPIASNLTLFAEWQPASASNLYSITYLRGSSDCYGSLPSTSGVSSDGKTATIQSNDLTRSGYFDYGWNTANDGTGTHYDPGQTISLSSNLILFPQWSKSTFDVYFHPNGGSGAMGKMTFDFNVAKALDANKFTHSGYDFVGWATLSSATTAKYADKQVVKNIAESSINLYALWRLNSGIKVTFNLDGGSSDCADLTGLNSSVSDIIPSSIPTKDGQVFEGWFFSSGSSDTSVRATSATTAADIAGLTTDTALTLTAHWSSVPFSIIYKTNGATGGVVTPTLALGGSGKRSVAPNSLTREGGIAAGWNTKADGSGIAYSGGEILELTSDLTLYAQFVDSNGALLAAASSDGASPAYSVSYNLNGGSGSLTDCGAVASDGVTAILASNTLTRSGYAANGWSTDPNGGGVAYANAATTVLDGNLTLYAAWVKSGDSGESTEKPAGGSETPEEASDEISDGATQNQGQNADKSDSVTSGENTQANAGANSDSGSDGTIAASAIASVQASAGSRADAGDGSSSVGGGVSGVEAFFAGLRSFADSLGAQLAYADSLDSAVKAADSGNVAVSEIEDSHSQSGSGFGFVPLLLCGLALIALVALLFAVLNSRRNRSE